MEEQAKSRTDEAVPQPAAASRLDDDKKRALELGNEAEHTDGAQREEKTQQAEELGR